ISGAGRGLGRTLVAAFVKAGVNEVLAGTRNQKDRDSLLRDFPARVTPLQLDVTSDSDVNAVAQLGPIDILVNNAATACYGNPSTMSLDDVVSELSVNYLGVLRLTRAVAPAMITQREGMIVNIATAYAKVNLPVVGTYCATKAALLSLGQALRAYLADDGVRVITVMPTTFDSDMSRDANVPKMTKEFVADEILAAIRDEHHDPPIGDEAKGVLDGLMKDPYGLEKTLMNYK